MMTRKSEMAEWILDFFRKSNLDFGQVILMRSIQNKLYELNPKERDMFMTVANELIDNGYFTYEDGPSQMLRLTKKGRDYIYDPDAKLDCCYDVQKLSATQSQYLKNLHNSFVNWINGVLRIIDMTSSMPGVTDDDKQALAQCRIILCGNDVAKVEESLSRGVVTNDVLNEIENLNKKLVDIIVERVKSDDLLKNLLKRLCYLIIEQDKSTEEMRLSLLRIPTE